MLLTYLQPALRNQVTSIFCSSTYSELFRDLWVVFRSLGSFSCCWEAWRHTSCDPPPCIRFCAWFALIHLPPIALSGLFSSHQCRRMDPSTCSGPIKKRRHRIFCKVLALPPNEYFWKQVLVLHYSSVLSSLPDFWKNLHYHYYAHFFQLRFTHQMWLYFGQNQKAFPNLTFKGLHGGKSGHKNYRVTYYLSYYCNCPAWSGTHRSFSWCHRHHHYDCFALFINDL